jgi:hypothetical protein
MATIGPKFYFGVTQTCDYPSMSLYSVWANGRPPLDGGDGVYIGRVWKQEGYGWVAAMPAHPDDTPDSWSAEVNRSVRHFATRKDACIFLWGFFLGTRRDAARQALATLPPFTSVR